MNTYRFFAVKNLFHGELQDHYELEADTFEDACKMAQEYEIGGAEQDEREPDLYDYYVELER